MIAFDLAYELSLGMTCTRMGIPAQRRGWLITGLLYVPSCVVGTVLWPRWQLMGLSPENTGWSILTGMVGVALVAGAYALGLRMGRVSRARFVAALVVAWTLASVAMFASHMPIFGEGRTVFLLVSGSLNAAALAYVIRQAW